METVSLIYFDNDYDKEIDYGNNNNVGVIETLLEYILNPSKTEIFLIYCKGLVYDDCPERLALQFYTTQALYNKFNGNKLSHLVISFSPTLRLDKFDVKDLAIAVADVIGEEFQVVSAVHTDKQHLHIHFIINSVSYKNGEYYRNNTINIKKYYEVIASVYKEMSGGRWIGKYFYYINK